MIGSSNTRVECRQIDSETRPRYLPRYLLLTLVRSCIVRLSLPCAWLYTCASPPPSGQTSRQIVSLFRWPASILKEVQVLSTQFIHLILCVFGSTIHHRLVHHGEDSSNRARRCRGPCAAGLRPGQREGCTARRRCWRLWRRGNGQEIWLCLSRVRPKYTPANIVKISTPLTIRAQIEESTHPVHRPRRYHRYWSVLGYWSCLDFFRSLECFARIYFHWYCGLGNGMHTHTHTSKASRNWTSSGG